MAQILIVEDNKNINELIKRNLQLVGHTCTQCFDGTSALTLLYQHTFETVISLERLIKISIFVS